MKRIRTDTPGIRQSQAGMVAIMTTLVLMIVISLIVLGFAQISRRNERESLDRQLSTQAFYAAESGVNDVRRLIQNAAAAGTAIPEKTTCTGTAGGFYASLSPTIDVTQNVKYSCLLVDASPKELTYSSVGQPSVIVPMTSASGAPFSTMKLTWKPKGLAPTAVLPGCPTSTANIFHTTNTLVSPHWTCGYGVLRFDLVPTDGALTMGGLQGATMTTFVVPQRLGAPSPASIPYAPVAVHTNDVRGVNCTADSCNIDVTGLSATSYYLRISSIYREVSLNICMADAPGNCMEVSGAQAIIDSTGRSQDVLRRIKVNIPLRSDSTNQLSDYAIQSTDSLCKRYSIMTGLISRDSLGVAGTSRLCGTGVIP